MLIRETRMNILVTGAKGMVGTALVNNLKNFRDGKNRTRPELHINEIYEYDIDSAPEELDEYCAKADFVFIGKQRCFCQDEVSLDKKK